MSDYDLVAAGKLKLKGDLGIKKKKKKNKESEKKQIQQINQSLEQKTVSNGFSPMKMTKAEMAFLKQQEKLQKQKILEKASLTHKQRVEDFNRKLDSLTEHFDIPKVSWTK